MTALPLTCSLDRKKDSDCFPGNSQKIGTFPVTPTNFFPASTFESYFDGNSLDQGLSNYIIALQEHSLLTNTTNDEEVYRFVWLRTFDHPISLRLQRSSLDFSLIIKQSDGKGGYGAGNLIVNREKRISVWEWIKFKELLEKECFWTMKPSDHEFGIDGATWILEGKRENSYHFMFKWDPPKGKFREACLYLLELSELNIGERDIY